MHVKKYALFQVACRLLSSYSMRSVVFVRVTKTTTHQSYKREPGLSELGGWGPEGPWPPRFGRSLNPISTGGQIVPTKLILAPPSSPGFLDFPTALRATDRSDLRPHQTPAAAIRIYFSGNFHDENLRPANFYHEDYEKCANHRVCERMSCEESKIFADVCRYNP